MKKTILGMMMGMIAFNASALELSCEGKKSYTAKGTPEWSQSTKYNYAEETISIKNGKIYSSFFYGDKSVELISTATRYYGSGKHRKNSFVMDMYISIDREDGSAHITMETFYDYSKEQKTEWYDNDAENVVAQQTTGMKCKVVKALF